MDNNKLSAKQRKKLEALTKRDTRKRVSKFRSSKKDSGDKLIQFYISEADKTILDAYKNLHGESNSEVFTGLIRKILKRRLNNTG